MYGLVEVKYGETGWHSQYLNDLTILCYQAKFCTIGFSSQIGL